MDDGVISTSQVVAWALWAWVFVLLTTAWIVGHQSDDIVCAGLLAATACASSAVAAVAHIKMYSVRVCAQLRANRAAIEGSRVCVTRMEDTHLRSL